MKEYYDNYAQQSMFSMPDLAQFDPSTCLSHAAHCCWPRDRQANDGNGNCDDPYDSKCVDKNPGDNTDLCYNELGKTPFSNDIDASGFTIYNDEGSIHCHGFAWAVDEQETTSRYKANALFFVSMYDHMYKRGYVENIPGSPMCGCVEHVSARILLIYWNRTYLSIMLFLMRSIFVLSYYSLLCYDNYTRCQLCLVRIVHRPMFRSTIPSLETKT